MLAPVTIRQVMQTPVETVTPDQSARTAASRLAGSEIGSLVICEHETPIGIITDVDLTELVAAGNDPETTTVREIMSSPLVTVDQSATIQVAAEEIREHGIKRLPVVGEAGTLVGIVTTTDLSNYIPHLVRYKRDHRPEKERTRHDVRADTAYENDDWEYEYFGDEGQIDVGDTVTFSKTVAEEDVRAFAEASGDTNRLHLEAPFAEKTRFGEQIAHGTLVAGLISAALARLPGLTIYLSQDLSFLGPVQLGERITAECAVIEHLGEDQFRLSTDVLGSDGEAVIEGEAVVISDTIPA
ncbi:MAG: CBS domain-containing protein [Halovenus sp.]